MRVFNFAAGPATLPVQVLEQVRDELLDWQGSGASVMEVSHRGKAFMAMAQESEALLRELLEVLDAAGLAHVRAALDALNVAAERRSPVTTAARPAAATRKDPA